VTAYRHPAAVRRLLDSLVGVVCPPEVVELGLGPDLVDHVELTMSALPVRFRQALVAGLLTYDLSALAWWRARGRRAHALPPELAERWYERWHHGWTPVERELARGVAQLLKMACYEHPTMQERLGYRPAAWIDQVSRRRLTVYGDEIRAAAAAVTAPDPLRPPVKRAATGGWERR